MSGLKRVRQLAIGPVEIRVAVPDRAAARISRSFLYQRALKPAAKRLLRRGKHSTMTAAAAPPEARLPAAPPNPGDLDPQAMAIIDRIAGVDWYHSIDLGHGVVTPGFVDHRPQVPEYHLPDSLGGLRCLDVATWDGFWAFEMEKRGAAEVVALDVDRWIDCDIPRVVYEEAAKIASDRLTGRGFAIAREILGSHVRRELCSVYDVSPQRLGTFDFIFVSDLLLHLRNPQLALERLFSVCRGMLLLGDVYNPSLERYGDLCLTQFEMQFGSETWWVPNTNTLKAMLAVAGFEPVEELGRFVLQTRATERAAKVVLKGSVPVRQSWRTLVDGRARELAAAGQGTRR